MPEKVITGLEDLTREQLIVYIQDLERRTADRRILRLEHDLHLNQEELLVQHAELKRAGMLLEQSRNRYAELYDFAPVGYLSLDRQTVIDQINLTAAVMLDAERSRLCGSPLTNFLPETSSKVIQGLVTHCLQEGERVKNEIVLASGKYVQIDGVRINDPDRGGDLVWMTFTDIDGRKEQERAVQDARAKLRTLIES